jgi:hypothetical protein
MISTIKETLASLKDPLYGSKIVGYPLKRVIWYWTKYLLVFSAIILVSLSALWVYFAPQLSKFAKTNLPDLQLRLDKGRLTITPDRPIKFTNPDGAFIADTRELPDDYSSYPAGIFIYRDKIELKQKASPAQTQSLADFQDFSTSKDQLVSFLNTNQSKILWTIFAAILTLGLLLTGFYWLFQLSNYSLAAIVIYYILKFRHTPLPFWSLYKLVIYASVLPLLISFIFMFAGGMFISLIKLAALVYFLVFWLKPMLVTKKTVPLLN